MILRTDLIPQPYAAFSAFPFIFVRPNSVNDQALIAHEMVHYREQAWQTPIWWLRYWLFKHFRLAAEVRAYKVSVQHGMDEAVAANWLMTYGTGVEFNEALALLRS